MEFTLLSELRRLGYKVDDVVLRGIQLKDSDIPEVVFHPHYDIERAMYGVTVYEYWCDILVCGFMHFDLETLMQHVEQFTPIIFEEWKKKHDYDEFLKYLNP